MTTHDERPVRIPSIPMVIATLQRVYTGSNETDTVIVKGDDLGIMYALWRVHETYTARHGKGLVVVSQPQNEIGFLTLDRIVEERDGALVDQPGMVEPWTDALEQVSTSDDRMVVMCLAQNQIVFVLAMQAPAAVDVRVVGLTTIVATSA